MAKQMWLLSIVFVTAFTFADCGDETKGGIDKGDLSVKDLYQAAIEDAKVAEPGEIVDTLIAIRPDNSDLIRDDKGRILMVTWTSSAGYNDKIGQDTDLAEDVWTTAAPEMQVFCQKAGLTGDALTLRLEQIIGLPPGAGYDRVAELWVPLGAMFRPSPDPEITDSVAELDFPEGTPEEHIDWINNLKATSYGPDGYPWTRLGYTYDWNADSREVGLSEFVVRNGSTVGVKAVTPTEEYCKRLP